MQQPANIIDNIIDMRAYLYVCAWVKPSTAPRCVDPPPD